MAAPKRFDNIERNPTTHAEHRKEVFWQITLPLLIGILVVVAATIGVIFAATQPESELRRWADVSVIWLILPTLLFTLIGMVILAGLVYAVSAVLKILPRYSVIALLYFETAKEKVSKISNQMVEPIIKARSSWAAVSWIGKKRA